jgi:ankyrin repeat protein
MTRLIAVARRYDKAIINAAKQGQDAKVRLLLERGAEVNSKDSNHRATPLHWTARNGHETVAKLLLENGAEVDSMDLARQTPLSWATQNRHETMAQLLLVYGAEVVSKDLISGPTPLSFDALPGNPPHGDPASPVPNLSPDIPAYLRNSLGSRVAQQGYVVLPSRFDSILTI